MGYRLIRLGAWCILGLVGCASHRELQQDRSRAGETAVQQEELSLLCSSNGQCSDGQACTIDLCVAGICVHGPDLGCCQSDDDCSTDVSCAVVSCVLNSCVQTPILGCGDADAASTSSGDTSDDLLGVLCGSDDDCEDGDPCTDDVCLVGGVCLFAANPLCCEAADDCDGVLACHSGECVDNRCSLTLIPGCGDDTGVSNGTALTSEPAGTSGSDTAGQLVTTADDDVTSELATTNGGGATGEQVTSSDAEVTTERGDSGESTAVALSGEATTDAAPTGATPTSEHAVTSAHEAGATSDEERDTKPSMADPWTDPMPVLAPFASGTESTEVLPGSSVADAGTAYTSASASTEQVAGDSRGQDNDDNGGLASAVMTSRMTGGACTLSSSSGETSGLVWMGIVVVAGLLGRRRK